MTALLISLLSLSLLLLTSPVLSQNPSYVPSLSWTASRPNILPRRTYPACAYNIHVGNGNSDPAMFVLGGELNYTNQVLENDVWYSTDGFYSDSHKIQPTSLVNVPNANFTHRRAGAAVYLNNGNLVWFGGKTDDPANANSGQLNSVYYSSDQAYTWYQATDAAAWSARSDIAACVPPFTNYIWQTGGQTPNGGLTNEVWTSNDGIGAVWTKSSSVVPFEPFQSGTCAFFYDVSATQALATMFLLTDTGPFYITKDYGVTWSSALSGPWNITGGSRNFMNVLIDGDNWVYVFSGQNYVDSNIYWSNNYGSSWFILAATNGLNLPNSVAFSYATTSCAALRLYQGTQNGLLYKSLAIYGGSVWLTDGSIVEAIHGVTTATVSYGANVPSITWTTAALAITPRRTYPACAYNVHGGPNSPPIMFMLGGEVNYTNQILTNDIWYSTDGFYSDSHQILPKALANMAGTNFTHRRAGSAVYLYNGNLVWFAGKNDDLGNASGGQLNTVYYSSDQGFTWNQVTATIPWTPRSDVAACTPPRTSVIYIAGGQISLSSGTGAVLNEVWISTDGTGSQWTQPTSTPPFAPFQSGACAFFYDSNLYNSSSSTSMATLFLIDNNGQFTLSKDYGATYSSLTFGPWLVSGQSRNFMNLLIDRDNYVYVFAGQNYLDPSIYFSMNYGTTWYTLAETNGLSLSDGAYFSYATTACAALRPYQINGQFFKSISIYGGSVWLSDGTIVESIHGITSQQITLPSFVPQISWSQASPNIMPRRTYPACTYNVHAPATSLPITFMLGGEVNYTNQILTNDIWYSTDGFYSDSHQIQPISLLNAVGQNFTHRRAGTAVYLNNGYLLWFGGKTDDPSSASAGQLNTVYYSGDNGLSWSQTTAQWGPRSDIAACVAPGTNFIFIAGGQISTGGQINEAWTSNDGIGAQWTQITATLPFAPFQSGACAFFYDSSIVNSSATSSMATLLLLDNDGQTWFSSNYGQSWTAGSYATIPWLVSGQSRNFMNLIIDRDNYAFAFSGQNYQDPNIYFSRDKGQTWNVLPATNNLALADGAALSYATTSCAAPILYKSATNGAYYKAISIYGGSIWLTDNTIVESIHGLTSLRSSVTSYGYVDYSAASQSSSGSSSSSSLSGGAIAGIVIGSVVGGALLLGVCIALCMCVGMGKRVGGAKGSHLEESHTRGTTNEVEISHVETQA